jgi:hypothetical protein
MITSSMSNEVGGIALTATTLVQGSSFMSTESSLWGHLIQAFITCKKASKHKDKYK